MSGRLAVQLLFTPEALALRHAMTEAHQALEVAFAEYQSALAQAHDAYERVPSAADNDVIIELRRQGRAHAEALTNYSHALMAWLIYVERHARPTGRAAGS